VAEWSIAPVLKTGATHHNALIYKVFL